VITALELENFKLFKKLSLPIAPRITLLGGKNDSGKTSVLEAIAIHLLRMNPNLLFLLQNWRGIPIINGDVAWKFIFNDLDLNKAISINLKFNGINEILKLTHNNSYFPASVNSSTMIPMQTDQLFTQSSLHAECHRNNQLIQESDLFAIPGGFTISSKVLSNPIFSFWFLPARVRQSPEETAKAYSKLTMHKKDKDLLKILRIVEPSINELELTQIGQSPQIFVDVGLNLKIPIDQLGNGVTEILEIFLGMANNPGGVVLVDEIFQGIHYSIKPILWSAILEATDTYNCQLIATTHSYEVLQSISQAIQEDRAKDVMYARINKDANGDSTPTVYNLEDLRGALSFEWEVR
jgi:AAA15 family ATPase/GTPase